MPSWLVGLAVVAAAAEVTGFGAMVPIDRHGLVDVQHSSYLSSHGGAFASCLDSSEHSAQVRACVVCLQARWNRFGRVGCIDLA